MLFQSDYCFRRTSGVNPHIEYRKDVDDVVFTRYIRLNGAHQLFVDCSRCTRVSPRNFDQLRICESLQYLDVSFTGLHDLNIIADNLRELRALNLAGLNVQTWEPLKYITTLESLSLRLSSKVTNKAVYPLKDCLRLRSLNLGYTDVSDVSFSKSLTRLEELVLDGSKMGSDDGGEANSNGDESRNDGKIEKLRAVLTSLPSLRVLNLTNTPLFDNRGDDGGSMRQRLLQAMPSSVYVELQNREHLFLQSIIDSDTTTFRRLVSDGAEIDKRIGLDARHLLLNNWKSRCTYKAQRLLMTPFFQIDHNDTKLQPRPIHLAILFNAFEILADMVSIGADLRGQVWFGDMKPKDGGDDSCSALMEIDYESLEDYEERKKEEETKRYVFNGRDTRTEEELRRLRLRRPHIYSLKELCDNVNERNCHRLVMDMVARKVNDWKLRCQRYSEDLVAILENRYQEQRLFREEETKRQEQEVRVIERRRAVARKKKEKTGADAGTIQGDEEEGKQKEASEQETVDDRCDDDEEEGKYGEAKEGDQQLLFIGPLPWKKPGRKPLRLMSPRNHALTYREHGLYARLNAPTPYSIPSEASGRDRDHFFLGRRDYWLESRAFVLEDRLQGEAAAAQVLMKRRQEDKVFELNYRRNQRVYGTKEYVGPGPSEPKRQDTFKASLKKTIDRKYIVREDSEDEVEEDEVRSQVTLESSDTLQEAGTVTETGGFDGGDASYDEPAEQSVDVTSRPSTALNSASSEGERRTLDQDQLHMSEKVAMQLAAKGATVQQRPC